MRIDAKRLVSLEARKKAAASFQCCFRLRVVTLEVGDAAEIGHGSCDHPFVVQLLAEATGSLVPVDRLAVSAAPDPGVAEVSVGERDPRRIVESFPVPQARQVPVRCRVVVPDRLVHRARTHQGPGPHRRGRIARCADAALDPVQALAGVAAQQPESPHRPGQIESDLRLGDQCPTKRRTNVVMLGLDPIEPGRLIRLRRARSSARAGERHDSTPRVVGTRRRRRPSAGWRPNSRIVSNIENRDSAVVSSSRRTR